MADFWDGKEPCWDFLGCPENVHSRCPAYHNRDKPCWEQATTQCRKVLDFEWECGDCKVFEVYARSRKKAPVFSRGTNEVNDIFPKTT